MNTMQKVKILGEAGKWDTCASSASPRKTTTHDRIGDVAAAGICHSFTENGRCISLFKTLMTNNCSHDCRYCQNSTHCQKTTATYQPEELAKVFMHLYVTNHVEGLFLSSAIPRDPDHTTQQMLDAVKLIREKYSFQGYVHFKILPGTSRDLIKQASEQSDRLSINLEAPNSSRLSEITSIKDYDTDIMRRQEWIKDTKTPAGQTTQLVVGGSDETDREILETVEWEYDKMNVRRVYYSAFTPIPKTPLESKLKTPYEREHRLYSVDFMMRKYGIPLKDFTEIMEDGDLPKGDPKIHLARHNKTGSVDVNTATYDELIRVPGIGPQSAQRIMSMRKNNARITKRTQLHSMGIVLKRADPFIKVGGKTQKTLIGY